MAQVFKNFIHPNSLELYPHNLLLFNDSQEMGSTGCSLNDKTVRMFNNTAHSNELTK